MTQTLSVIIPVYNAEKYLPDCLDSVLAQTYVDTEIILVDDGSSDGSCNICDDYALRDARIRVIHKSNGGQLSARREGLLIATGAFVTCVDADDVIMPDMYEYLMTKLTANGADIITCGFITYRDEAMTQERAREHDFAPEGIYRGEDLRFLCSNMFVSSANNAAGSKTGGKDLLLQTLCTKIYRKDLLMKYIMTVSSDIRSWEDLCYSLPPFADASCVEITHSCFYKYRPNPSSTTHTIQRELAFSRSLRSMEAAEKNYALCGTSVLNAFYRKAATIFYMDLWKDFGQELSVRDLDDAAASAVFRRIVLATRAENKMHNKRVLRFLLPLAKGNVRGAIHYCKFSRLLTEWHIRVIKLPKTEKDLRPQ